MPVTNRNSAGMLPALNKKQRCDACGVESGGACGSRIIRS